MTEAATKLYDELCGDDEVGEMVDEEFEVARYAAKVMEMEDVEIKKRLEKIETVLSKLDLAMEMHSAESLDALIRGTKKNNVLRRDAEAVEIGAKDLKRRAKGMARKMQEPYEQCSWRVSRLKSIYEANQLIRRCQRALFLFRRLEEKDLKTGDLRELAKIGALLREIDEIVHPAPSLLKVDALRQRVEKIKSARTQVESTAADALDRGLRSLKQTQVDASLRCALALGCGDQALEKAVDRLANDATTAAKALFERFSEQKMNQSARDLAQDWATAIESSIIRARLIDKTLRAKHFSTLISYKQAVSGHVWLQAAKAVSMCLCDALAPPTTITQDDETVAEVAEILEKKKEEEQSLQQNLAKKLEAEVKAAAKKVLEETSVRGQALVEKSKLLVEQSKRTLLGTNISSTPAAKAALSLAASYPSVRRCFVAMTRRIRTSSSTAFTNIEISDFPQRKRLPLKNKAIWKRLEKRPLRSAALHAPAKSVVSLCEAQFLEIMALGRKKRYQPHWQIDLEPSLKRACNEKETLPPNQDEGPFGIEYLQYLRNLQAAVTKYRGSDVFECIMLPDEDDSDEYVDDEFEEPIQPPKKNTIAIEESNTISPNASIMIDALDPLREKYADLVRARLLEPVLLMFPADHEGFEAMVPTRNDAGRLAQAVKTELKSALDDSGDVALVPIILKQAAQAIDEFARRAITFVAEYEKKKMIRTTAFSTLSAAIDTNSEWRATAGEEREAQLATLCASLRALLIQHLRELVLHLDEYNNCNDVFNNVLGPAMASLDRVSERVALRGLDALAYRIELEFSDSSRSIRRSTSNDSESEACSRAKRALELGRRGYIAVLPSWHCDKFDSPATRSALTALAARLARSAASHAALRGAAGAEESRLSAAADAAALDDTLSAYEITNESDQVNATFRFLGTPSKANAELIEARRELMAFKRLLFIEAASSPTAFLNSARELVAEGSLRPSVAWHALLAAAKFSPLPFELAEPERGGGSATNYIAWLVAGPERFSFVDFDPTSTNDIEVPSDHPLARLEREADAWRDIQRCLAAFANNAAEQGEVSLGSIYDAIYNHGNSLLSTYKNIIIRQQKQQEDSFAS